MLTLDENSGRLEEIIKEQGSLASVIKGVSMRPLLKTDRDVIIVSALTGDLKKYDVPLYKVGKKYVLHRIIGVDKEKRIYIIRGDNTYKKEYVPFDAVIGCLTSFNRCGKHYSVSHFGYRAYARFWHFIYPFRYMYVTLKSRLRALLRRLFRKGH
ncbi:MAG: S24/S26 family peptidase [Clostridia bacterium]|nr:S24/S26 family peptidase [Clostridia bacterium]